MEMIPFLFTKNQTSAFFSFESLEIIDPPWSLSFQAIEKLCDLLCYIFFCVFHVRVEKHSETISQERDMKFHLVDTYRSQQWLQKKFALDEKKKEWIF